MIDKPINQFDDRITQLPKAASVTRLHVYCVRPSHGAIFTCATWEPL